MHDFLKNEEFSLSLQNWIFYENSCLDNNKSKDFIGDLFIKASEKVENNMFFFYSVLVSYGYKFKELEKLSQFEILELSIIETKLRGLSPFYEFLETVIKFFPENENILILKDSTKADLDSLKNKKPSKTNDSYSQLERM